jgi:hypothetical protein
LHFLTSWTHGYMRSHLKTVHSALATWHSVLGEKDWKRFGFAYPCLPSLLIDSTSQASGRSSWISLLPRVLCGDPVCQAISPDIIWLFHSNGLWNRTRDVICAIPPYPGACAILSAGRSRRTRTGSPCLRAIPATLLETAGHIPARACREPRCMGLGRLVVPRIRFREWPAARFSPFVLHAFSLSHKTSQTRQISQSQPSFRPRCHQRTYIFCQLIVSTK